MFQNDNNEMVIRRTLQLVCPLPISGDPLSVELVGGDEQHVIEDVLFENVVLNGKPVTRHGLRVNASVKNLVIRP